MSEARTLQVWRWLAAAGIAVAAGACNGNPSSDGETGEVCPVGSSACPCTVGGACDAGLQCLSDLCVDPGSESETESEAGDGDGDSETETSGDGDGDGDGAVPCVEWSDQYGNNDTQHGHEVAVASDNSVYITGENQDPLEGQSNAGTTDAFMTKYDAEGTRVWTKQMGTSQADGAFGVATFGADRIYFTGDSNFTFDGQPSAGSGDVFLTAMNADGLVQWTRLFGSSAGEWGTDVATGPNGNIYVTGGAQGDLDGQVNAGWSDALLLKYDEAGNRQWTRFVGTVGIEIGEGVAVSPAGDVFVAGYTGGFLNSQSQWGAEDALVAKFNADGVEQWVVEIGTGVIETKERARAVAADSQGNVIITGVTDGDLGGPNAGTTDIFLIKLDGNGDEVWSRQYGSNGTQSGLALTTNADDEIFVAGGTFTELHGVGGPGGFDAFVSKYDAEGEHLWTRVLGTPESDSAVGIAVDTHGHAYITGSTAGEFGGPFLGEQDVYVARVCQ